MNARALTTSIVAGLVTLWLWDKLRPSASQSQAPAPINEDTGSGWLSWF